MPNSTLHYINNYLDVFHRLDLTTNHMLTVCNRLYLLLSVSISLSSLILQWLYFKRYLNLISFHESFHRIPNCITKSVMSSLCKVGSKSSQQNKAITNFPLHHCHVFPLVLILFIFRNVYFVICTFNFGFTSPQSI